MILSWSFRVLATLLIAGSTQFDGALAAEAERIDSGRYERPVVDTPRATKAGATFVAPGGWTIQTNGSAVILSPEGDSKIALVDVEQGKAVSGCASKANLLRSMQRRYS